jgi:DNA polymerase (family 10)
VDNKQIVRHLKTIVTLSEIQEVNPFKIRAFSNAIISIERSKTDLKKCTLGDLEKIDGVGKSIADQIDQLVRTGSCSQLEALVNETPPGILEIMKLPGLGAKKIRMLWKELHIDSLERFKEELEKGTITKVKGFGEKTVKTLQESLNFYLEQQHKELLPEGLALAQSLFSLFSSEHPESRWEITGQVRRQCQVIDQIELLGERKKQRALQTLKNSPLFEFLPRESSPYILRAVYKENGLPVWIRLAEEDQFETELFRSTGAPEHVQKLLDLNEKGEQTNELTEETMYLAAGLPVYPPEIRETSTPLDLTSEDIESIIQHKDIQGILHAHSSYSDGMNSLEEMAEAAREAGYSYLGITDHSKSSFFYANGLFENRIRDQHKEIDSLNSRYSDFRIFKGIECDILPDGSLDYSQEVLESFDFVICSVHSVLSMDRTTATKRLLKAIENPCTTILGHMTGRILLRRKGYPVMMEPIIEACAKHQVAIELNANPHRLDVDWEWIRQIVSQGVKISINPDAHSIEGYKDNYYGVSQARKALVKTEDNLTSMGAEALFNYFQSARTVSSNL